VPRAPPNSAKTPFDEVAGVAMDPANQQLQCCIMSAIILAIIGPATYWLNSIILIPEKIPLSPAIGVSLPRAIIDHSRTD
jgi:hypothetical protein